MADWVMPFQGTVDQKHGRRARCRVRIYEHEQIGDNPHPRSPLVVFSDLPDNEGESVASAAEVLVETTMTLLADLLSREALSARGAADGVSRDARACAAWEATADAEEAGLAGESLRVARTLTFLNHYPPAATGRQADAYDLIRFDEPRPVRVPLESAEDPAADPDGRRDGRTLWCVDGTTLVPLDEAMVGELLGEAARNH